MYPEIMVIRCVKSLRLALEFRNCARRLKLTRRYPIRPGPQWLW